MKTEKEYLLTLSGRELFDIYLSRNDEYSSVLLTARIEIGDALFPLLEKAERMSKKVVIKQDSSTGVLDAPMSFAIE